MTSRPVRALLTVAVGALALVGVLAPTANAATYPPVPPGVTVPSTPVAPGAPVLISACCFEPGSTVTFQISGGSGANVALGSSRFGAALVPAAPAECTSDSASCVATAEDDGQASANITFTGEGTFSIAASGTGIDGQPLTVTSSLTVGEDAAAPAPGEDGDDPDAGGLADTGSDLITYGIIGLALVAAGAVVVTAVRRRRPTQSAV